MPGKERNSCCKRLWRCCTSYLDTIRNLMWGQWIWTLNNDRRDGVSSQLQFKNNTFFDREDENWVPIMLENLRVADRCGDHAALDMAFFFYKSLFHFKIRNLIILRSPFPYNSYLEKYYPESKNDIKNFCFTNK